MKLGGYRQLKSFQHAELVYDSTVKFCDRFIDRRSRQLEKAFLQKGGFTEGLYQARSAARREKQ
jgi:four helix bundle suffix protein